MLIEDIRNRLQNKSSIGTRKLKDIDGIVLHHTGTSSNLDEISQIQGIADYHVKKGWGHISYHYVIGKAGKIYYCLTESEIGAHAGEWNANKSMLAICALGDYTKERPRAELIGGIWSALDYLCTKRPDLPRVIHKTLKTHKEVRPTPTSCPSDILHNLAVSYRT